MRDSRRRALDAIEFPAWWRAASDYQADSEPPAPTQLLARLGLMLVIALAFGLIAQLLCGVPR